MVSSGAKNGNLAEYLVLPLPEGLQAAQAGAAVLLEIVTKNKNLGPWLISAVAQEPERLGLQGGRWQISMNSIPQMGGNVLLITDSDKAPNEQPAPVRQSELTEGREFAPARAPFKIHVLRLWPNCRLYHKPSSMAQIPEVTKGVFANAVVEPLPEGKTTDDRNHPSVVLEVISSQGSLGTWLLSTAFKAKQGFDVNGTHYDLALRYQRHYQPFSITLLKASHTEYPGTDIPKDFRSRVQVRDGQTGEMRESEIYMNAPLRFAGFTFFQYQMDANDNTVRAGLRPSSTFQVVKNPSWLTPYISCGLVGMGLFVQFVMHLVGFIVKRSSA